MKRNILWMSFMYEIIKKMVHYIVGLKKMKIIYYQIQQIKLNLEL